MKQLGNGKLPGGTIAEDSSFNGQFAGDVTVAAPATLELQGQVVGDLTVEDGATVILRGMVTGDLVNRGNAEILGTISGALRDESGTAVVNIKSSIGS